ncbi:MAG: L-seryl-tRNA(Sec) selenium transferase [Caldimonas sp.]
MRHSSTYPCPSASSPLPSVDGVMRCVEAQPLVAQHGRDAVIGMVRHVLAQARSQRATIAAGPNVLTEVGARLALSAQPSLRPVFNLTGTVLHTNLGRAVLPREAIEAMVDAARGAVNLEYDLELGERGERDAHLELMLRELTGAEAATVVNNNAAALLLVLNTLAMGKNVPTSRGELVEIGGSFRLPDIMARSGCRLLEVGTTNRTHLHDFAQAIDPDSGLVLKVHASNFAIEGFSASVPEAELARLCGSRGVPFVIDLGSGALIDLSRFGLPHEPTVAQALKSGADLVTFSTDKLLGGPQAGVIAGRADLVAQVRRNPMKRALRVDKLTIAALAAVLRLYGDPDRLVQRLPTLHLLTRPQGELQAMAERLRPAVQSAVGAAHDVQTLDCDSQIGSGALPVRTLPSAGLAILPGNAALALAFRRLPVPVLGRLHGGRFLLDLRCLQDEDGFVAQLPGLTAPS